MRTLPLLETVSPEEVGFSAARLGRIDEVMDRLIDERKLPSAVTLVARHGKVAHFSAVGPVQRDALFRIASMTKPITCVAGLMLYEEGHFLLDDPIADFLPEFGGTRVYSKDGLQELVRPISIRHLFMHTSGIGYWWSSIPALGEIYRKEGVGEREEPLAEMVRRLAAIPLNHQPGVRWTYGFSHDVLGRMIEVISGKSLDVFLRERIFEPLQMVDTDFQCADADRMPATYLTVDSGGLERLERPDLDRSRPPVRLSGGGGLVSTTGDYARFCQMLLNGGFLGDARLLGRKTVQLMTTNLTGDTSPFPPAWAPDWSMAAYGFGLGVRVLIDVAKSNSGGSPGEYGWSGSQSTYFFIDPVEDLFGIFMTQLEPAQFRHGRVLQSLAYQAIAD